MRITMATTTTSPYRSERRSWFICYTRSLSISISCTQLPWKLYFLPLSLISLKLFHREIILGVVMCNCILFNLLSSVLLQLYLVSPPRVVPKKASQKVLEIYCSFRFFVLTSLLKHLIFIISRPNPLQL